MKITSLMEKQPLETFNFFLNLKNIDYAFFVISMVVSTMIRSFYIKL